MARQSLLDKCRRATREIVADAQAASSSPKLEASSPAVDGLEALPREELDSLVKLATRLLGLREIAPRKDQPSDHPVGELIAELDGEIKKTYNKFYDFVYQDLPFCWRHLYTDLSILKFNLLVRTWLQESDNAKGLVNDSHNQDGSDRISSAVDEMVATLDKALILAGGAGVKRGRRVIEDMLVQLEDVCRGDSPRSLAGVNGGDSAVDLHRPSKRPKHESGNEKSSKTQWNNDRSFSSKRVFDPTLKHPIKRVSQMSMAQFQTYMDDGHARGDNGPLPIIIRGITDEWPALTCRPWRKPAYLYSRTFGGRRLVPVEVGRSYVDEGWGQELVPFRELLRRMEEKVDDRKNEGGGGDGGGDDPSSSAESSNKPHSHPPISYLAQHELFTQIPTLRNDIPTPDLCYTTPPPHLLSPSLNKPELPLPLVNAWLGPAGTITPLHTDGYHNLLAQVVGAKYVRLYSPLDSEALCPRGEDDDGVDMHNTSAFDVGVVEGWDDTAPGEDPRDEIELAEFRGLRYWEAVLEEGDVLYVPIGWWHYVRSLSVSFSVSFWWNGDHDTAANDVEA